MFQHRNWVTGIAGETERRWENPARQWNSWQEGPLIRVEDSGRDGTRGDDTATRLSDGRTVQRAEWKKRDGRSSADVAEWLNVG